MLSSCRKHDENLERSAPRRRRAGAHNNGATSTWPMHKTTRDLATFWTTSSTTLPHLRTANTLSRGLERRDRARWATAATPLLRWRPPGDYVKNTADVSKIEELRQRSLPLARLLQLPVQDLQHRPVASVVFGNQLITLGTTTYTGATARATRQRRTRPAHVCLAGIVGEAFWSAAEPAEKRLGYAYGGLQNLHVHAVAGVEWCTETYDPRFRPWYAAAARAKDGLSSSIGVDRRHRRTEWRHIQAGKKVIAVAGLTSRR